jgi:hypothetical protein
MGKYSQQISRRLRNKQEFTILPFWDKPTNFNLVKFDFGEHYERVEWCRTTIAEGLPKDQAPGLYDWHCSTENWHSKDYWVSLDKTCYMGYKTFQRNPVWHPRICRHDLAPCQDWQVFQAIKNEIVGPEYEAVELYPAHSRMMDVGNMYHFWVLAPNDGEETPPQFKIGVEPHRYLVAEKDVNIAKIQELLKRFPGHKVQVVPEPLCKEAEREFPDTEDAMRLYAQNHPELELPLFDEWLGTNCGK